MANEYCTVQDLYRHGLPRGALANPGQLVASISTSTGVYTLDGHGFGDSSDRTPVTFAFQADGALQGGVVAGTTYYAEALTDSTFKVYAASSGGSAMVPATAGSLVVVVATLDLLKIIAGASRLVDDHIPAHAVPLAAPVPVRILEITAILSIERAYRATGQSSEASRLAASEALADLRRYRSGIPVRDAAAGSATNTAIRQPITTTTSGWGPASGSIP